MGKKTQERIGLGTLIEALDWCINEDSCCGCPLTKSYWNCSGIIKYNSLRYLRSQLRDKGDEEKPAQAPEEPEASPLPAHWIWTDDGVINPDNVLYVQLDGPQTKIRMVEGKMYLNGDPFGLTQRTKPREKPKDLEDD